ncbi:MAG TPA: alkaline phosphatase family protein [Terriglobales bacterium]|nr:alkaline phosphatase family protein [Terriglobales bacterium]
MKRSAALLLLCSTLAVRCLFAAEGAVPKGVPHLDHVFVIMMENHGYAQILNNPNAPFINQLAKSANSATNYFAVGHPSLTNYLEFVGASNFGVRSDNSPDWHNTSCTTNLASGIANTDTPASPNICPIFGTGTDAATPAIDYTNETSGPPGELDINGIVSVPAAPNTSGKTIADQLVEAGRSWKSYQESLPLSGADLVNISDGFYTNNTDFSKILPVQNPPLTSSDVVALYAVKHNPFAYFRSVQEGNNPRNSLKNTVGFEGPNGLYADLGSGHVPTFSFIAPNQCDDQHGRGNAGPFCNYDPDPGNTAGTQAGVNPALIYRGDVTVQKIVTAIKHSPAWHDGRNAIVILWDENDYSIAPITNQVMFIVDTNYGKHGVQSGRFYTHFSALKSIESGLGLPCLNHACDSSVPVMTDLFSSGDGDGDWDDL